MTEKRIPAFGGIASILLDVFVILNIVYLTTIAYLIEHVPASQALNTTSGAAQAEVPEETVAGVIVVNERGTFLGNSADAVTDTQLEHDLRAMSKAKGVIYLQVRGLPTEEFWLIKSRFETVLGREVVHLP